MIYKQILSFFLLIVVFQSTNGRKIVNSSEKTLLNRNRQRAFRRELLPTLISLASSKIPSGVKYELLGCSVDNTKNGCVWTFKPDKLCKEKLSLGKVFNHLINKPDKKLETLTKSVFPSNVFEVDYFVINTCGDFRGDVEFKCKTSKSFDIIQEKLELTKGELLLKFNYIDLAESFSIQKIGIELNGICRISSHHFIFEAKKAFSSTETKFSFFTDNINVAEIWKLFTSESVASEKVIGETKKSNKNLLKDGGTFSNAVIQKPKISAIRFEDGSYEIVAKGSITNIPGFGEISGILVIQKPVDDLAGVGFVIMLKKIDPLKIISEISGKDLSFVKILKDIFINLSVEYASKDMANIKESQLNEVLGDFLTNTTQLTKGIVINVKLPIKQHLKNIGVVDHLENVPEEMLVQIIVNEEKISFKFPEDIFYDSMNVLAALVPKAVTLLQKYVFKSNFNIIVKKYDVNVKTKEIKIAISMPGEVFIGTKFLSVKHGYFEITYDAQGNFEFALEAELQLAGACAKIHIKKIENKFDLKGSLAALTSIQLMKGFNMGKLAKKTVDSSKTFNFGIQNLTFSASFGEGLSQEFRVYGNPILFGWDGLKFEAFLLREVRETDKSHKEEKIQKHIIKSSSKYSNETFLASEDPDMKSSSHNESLMRQFREKIEEVEVEDLEMAMAVMMNNVRVDHIIYSLFDKRVGGTNWLVNLDVALVLSNTKKDLFTLPDLKEMIREPEKGIYFSGKLGLPENCNENSLCELAKKKMKPNAKLFVNAGFKGTEFFFQAGYDGGALDFGEKVRLNKAYFEITVGLSTEFSLKGQLTLHMEPENLVFKVSIGVTLTASLKLSGEMEGMWHKPFGIPNFAVGNNGITVSLQPSMFIPNEIALHGQMNLGITGKAIEVKGAIGIDLLKPWDSFIYASINKLSLGAFAKAFNYDLNLQQVYLDTGFPKGLTVAFTSNPNGIDLPQFKTKIRTGFTLRGEIDILGYKVDSFIQISEKRIHIEVQLSPFCLFHNMFCVYRSKRTRDWEGPKILISLSLTSAKFVIKAGIDILGISAEVDIDVGDKGIRFTAEGSLFGIATASLAVKTPYIKNKKLEENDFMVASCISISQASKEANQIISSAAKNAASAEKLARKNDARQVSWYERINRKLDRLQKLLERLEMKMSKTANKISAYDDVIETLCHEKCKNVDSFSRLWCNYGCKIDQKIAKSQRKAKTLHQEWNDAKYKMLISLVNHAQYILNRAKDIIEEGKAVASSVKHSIKAGLKAAKDILLYVMDNIIEIHFACFNISLEVASGACFEVKVNITVAKQSHHELNINICFVPGFLVDIGKMVSEWKYPNILNMDVKIKELSGQFQIVEDKEIELEKEQEVDDKMLKNLEEELEVFKETNFHKKKDVVLKNYTISEIRRQMYKDFPSINNDDDLKALEDDYLHELSFHRTKTKPLGIFPAILHLSNKTKMCKRTKVLVDSYEKISDHVVMSLKEPSSVSDPVGIDQIAEKIKGIKEEAEKKCDQEECDEELRKTVAAYAKGLSFAFQNRLKKLKLDDHLRTRTLNDARVKLAHEINRSGMNVKKFLNKLKPVFESTSLEGSNNLESTSLEGSNNLKENRLKNAYEVLKGFLLKKEKKYLYWKELDAFHKIKNDMVFLRNSNPCA